MIKTIRHDDLLLWGCKRVTAPRKFELNGYTYFVHIIDGYCTKVMVYIACMEWNLGYNVALYGFYQVYSTNKGIYFKIKGERIYLGE